MTLQFELAGSQIDGSRDYQEDAFLITNLTDKNGNPSALVIVADGMGGHAAGNVASNMAVQAFNKHVSANYPSVKPAEVLRECVLKANASIQETVKETPALAGMGCTLVAAILEDNKLWWASVGDSHIYLLRNKELIKKNADHSYGGYLDRMAAAGTPLEPEKGLSRNMLMSAITGDEINEIDVPSEPLELEPGDRLLICSDGLDTLSAGKIIQFSDWSESPKECADALMNAVTEAGLPKQDNTTAVVVNISARKAPAVAATPPPESVTADDMDRTFDENIPAEAKVQIKSEPPPQVAANEPGKGKTGLIAGVIVVIIAAAVGVFLFTGGTGQDQVDTTATTEPVTVANADQTATAVEADTVPVATTEAPVTTASRPAQPDPAPQAAQSSTTVALSQNAFQDRLKDGSPGPEMVIIPDGSYDMGSPNTSRNADERPRHTVNIKKFAISKYEVTFSQYDKFARETGRRIPDNLYMERETHPVIFVSWDDAYYYAQWLAEQTGKKYRLPTEAEWEYAGGTGKRSPFWWGYNEEPGHGHCFGCGTGLDPRKPTKTGSFDANDFGIYDTTGNVAEWNHDCWHENYQNAPTNGRVWEGGDCAYRVARGGAYSSPFQSVRHTKRDKFKSDQAYDHIGIRLARDMD
jgi:formylglycine-generating enzyme required for sulfatase activity/serine/threonine protein phosphatase PrpC